MHIRGAEILRQFLVIKLPAYNDAGKTGSSLKAWGIWATSVVPGQEKKI